jgi:hypothetical protein
LIRASHRGYMCFLKWQIMWFSILIFGRWYIPVFLCEKHEFEVHFCVRGRKTWFSGNCFFCKNVVFFKKSNFFIQKVLFEHGFLFLFFRASIGEHFRRSFVDGRFLVQEKTWLKRIFSKIGKNGLFQESPFFLKL